jgi:hypothetical protein
MSEARYIMTIMTGRKEMPTTRPVWDMDTNMHSMEEVTPGRIVSEEEFNNGYVPPPDWRNHVRLVQGGTSRIVTTAEACALMART